MSDYPPSFVGPQGFKRVRFKSPLADRFEYKALTPTSSDEIPTKPDGLRRLFFRAFEGDEPSNHHALRSIILPTDSQAITILVYGNQMELRVMDQEVTLKLSKRVCNVQQLNERQNLVRRIRRLDEAIDQTLRQLSAVREAWRLRGNIPDSFERHEYDQLQQTLAMYNAQFVSDCTTLHQIWALDPETGIEYHSWTLTPDDDSIAAIFLPDLRPGEEDRYIEARFWFGCASMPTTVNMPAADVTVVPDCIAPYRPFDVPAMWCDQTKCALPKWEPVSVLENDH